MMRRIYVDNDCYIDGRFLRNCLECTPYFVSKSDSLMELAVWMIKTKGNITRPTVVQ